MQQELLTKKEFTFRLGSATLNEVIAAQRSLVLAETSEVSAKGAYSRARIGLDQTMGVTLEKNRISLVDALNGVAGN